MPKKSGTARSIAKKSSQDAADYDTPPPTPQTIEKKSYQGTADDDSPLSTPTAIEKMSSQITTDDNTVLPLHTEFITTMQDHLLVISKSANSSSAGYHYQTAVTLFQAISMVCESERLLSFWTEPTWNGIVEEGIDDIDMRSAEGHRYLMQVKYRTSDTISLTAYTSDYFKHISYHLRLAVRNREEYVKKKVKVEYWSFAKPISIIAEWQTELLKEKYLSERVIANMKDQLKGILSTAAVKEALKADLNEITRIEDFLNDQESLLSFLTSHYIRSSILWEDLMIECSDMLTKYIEKNYPELKETEHVVDDLYLQLHHDLIDRNIMSSDVEMRRQPLSERAKHVHNEQQKADQLLRNSPDFKTLHSKNSKELKEIIKEYDIPSSNLKKDDLILRILKEKKEIGLVQKEIQQQKIEKALESVGKRLITVAYIKTCLENRVKKHMEQGAQEEFKNEIEKHMKIFREWQKKSIESSPAKWYIDSVTAAIPQLQVIVHNETVPLQNRAKLLSGWFSQLCLQYGNVPDSDRDKRHKTKENQRIKKKRAAAELANGLSKVYEKPELFTEEKLIEMKDNVNTLTSRSLEKDTNVDNDSKKTLNNGREKSSKCD